MRRKNILLIVVVINLVLIGSSHIVYADKIDPSSLDKTQIKVYSLIEKYVQQMVIQSVLSTTGEIIQRAIIRGKLKIFPQIGYQAIQQAAFQVFKQGSTKEITEDAFEQSYDIAIEQYEEQMQPGMIQKNVKDNVEGIIQSMRGNQVFKIIIERILKQAMIQQQKMLVMQVAQRQMQLALVQKQRMAMYQAMVQMYQKAIQRSIMEQQKRAFQSIEKQATMQAAAQQKAYQNAVYQDLQKSVQQQHLQASQDAYFRKQQEIMRAKYKQAF